MVSAVLRRSTFWLQACASIWQDGSLGDSCRGLVVVYFCVCFFSLSSANFASSMPSTAMKGVWTVEIPLKPRTAAQQRAALRDLVEEDNELVAYALPAGYIAHPQLID